MSLPSAAELLYNSFRENEDREALPGWTYADLGSAIEVYRRQLREKTQPGQCVAILSGKSTATYAMWLACWFEGRPTIFLSASQGEFARSHILTSLNPKLIFNGDEISRCDHKLSAPVAQSPENIVYYIATSGSTGVAKIIRVSQQSLSAWIQNSSSTWDIKPYDRVSQVFDLSFDPAISDLLWALLSGACLVPLDFAGQLDVPHWIEKNHISIWSSSPSQAKAFVLSRGSVQGNKNFLRRSTFIGEILTSDFVNAWHRCFPQSIIENHYGPAECVISVSREIIHAPLEPGLTLSVGAPFSGVDFSLNKEGILVITSDQVADGYLDEVPRGFSLDQKKKFYSGDLASVQSGQWKILGRMDSQIKVSGQRWECEGIEACIESITQVNVCAVKWSDGFFDGIDLVVFGKTPASFQKDLGSVFGHQLPASLRPKRIYFRDQKPLNSSGKTDRALVKSELETGKLKNGY